MSEQPRYSTLADYVDLLRRRGLTIAIAAFAGLALALLASAAAERVYEAESKLQFSDPLTELQRVGLAGDAIADIAPDQRFALNAELVKRPEVTALAARNLGGDIPVADLVAAVQTGVNPETTLIEIEARWGDAETAAAIANAYAEASQEIETAEFRDRLEQTGTLLRRQLADARRNLRGGKGARATANTAAATATIADLQQRQLPVRTLRQVEVDPVGVVELAQPPEGPASPRPLRNGIIGLLLGAVLGTLLAFGREALDGGIGGGERLGEELDAPVVGRIPEDALEGEGEGEGAAVPTLGEGERLEPFRVLAVNLAALDREDPPRSVLVAGATDDADSAGVSLALAEAAALDGTRTVLLESNLRNPTLALRAPLEPSPGLADYLAGAATEEEIVQHLLLGSGEAPTRGEPTDSDSDRRALACIPAGAGPARASELMQGPKLGELCRLLAAAYELVIVDAAPLLAVADPLRIAPHLDATLVCIHARESSREQIRALASALEGPGTRPLGTVLTGLRPGDAGYDHYRGYAEPRVGPAGPQRRLRLRSWASR